MEPKGVMEPFTKPSSNLAAFILCFEMMLCFRERSLTIKRYIHLRSSVDKRSLGIDATIFERQKLLPLYP